MAVGFDPISRKELYLDVITGGDSELPEPLTREEKYLGKIAGMSVDIPEPLTRYEQYLYAIANGDTLTLNPIPRLEMYLAKACGQDIDVPEPITREEKYWFDYINGGRWEVIEYTGAVPVEILAAGEPLIDYLISGNMSQTGTPTPASPIQPQECGERTAQLWRNLSDYSGNGVTIRSEIDGLYFSGTCTSSANVTVNAPLAAGTYTLKANANRIPADDTNACIQIYWNTSNIPTIQNRQAIAGYSYFTVASDVESVQYRIRLQSGVNYDGFILRPVLNIGGAAKPFEPYGYKIPISSANTTTPVYLGEVETTRQVKKLVLTGEETNWYGFNGAVSGVGVSLLLSDMLPNSRTNGCCTHFAPQLTPSGSAIDGITFGASNASLYITFSVETATALNLTNTTIVKAWLAAQYAAGTPVTVWYVLANPTTGIVNEPLRKIGDYADTISAEQAGVSIPTVEGTNVVDVETTLKPSEIYLKYKGRAS